MCLQDDITGDGTTSNVLIIGELLKQADIYISEVCVALHVWPYMCGPTCVALHVGLDPTVYLYIVPGRVCIRE